MTDNKRYSIWFEYLDKHLDDVRNIVWMYAGTELALFDRAYETKDRSALESCMNHAWFCVPDNRSFYNLSGFVELCNLLDSSIQDWEDAA
jgi:hypothetical protein